MGGVSPVRRSLLLSSLAARTAEEKMRDLVEVIDRAVYVAASELATAR